MQAQPLAVQAQWVQGAITVLMIIGFICYSVSQVLSGAKELWVTR